MNSCYNEFIEAFLKKLLEQHKAKYDELIMKSEAVNKIISSLNLFQPIEHDNRFYCSWWLIFEEVLLGYDLEYEYFSWEIKSKPPDENYYISVSFNDVLESDKVPDNIKEKLLFHLDLFR